ncbi:MAG: hypothetical protein ACFFAO_02120 [Candidatus Hermodarchaeota archaeon]
MNKKFLDQLEQVKEILTTLGLEVSHAIRISERSLIPEIETKIKKTFEVVSNICLHYKSRKEFKKDIREGVKKLMEDSKK